MIRRITNKHRARAHTRSIYKVVKVEENGTLKSLWVKGTKKKPFRIDDESYAVALTYKEDRVISDGKYGIWCCSTYEKAVKQARSNGCHKLCRIYKVYPIGRRITPPEGWCFPDAVLYPAIIMGKHIETIDDR